MDIKRLLIGTAIFFLGYFLSITLHAIIPLFVETYNSPNNINEEKSNIAGIIEIGVIIIYLLGMIGVPIGFYISGLHESESDKHVFGMLGGILWFFFTVLLLYFGWFMIRAMGNSIDDTLLAGIFWAGCINILLWNLIIIPGYVINKARNTI